MGKAKLMIRHCTVFDWRPAEEWASRHQVVVSVFLVILFMTSRLPGLMALPPFLDERLVLSHAYETATRGLPGLITTLAFGGRVLLTTVIAALGQLTTVVTTLTGRGTAHDVDWLMIGRFTTTWAGALAMLGCFHLGRELWSFRVGLISALLYLLVPYAYFYDRMVMAEPFISAAAVWLAITCLRIVRSSGGNSVLLAALICTTLLTKPIPAIFFSPLPLWAWLWFRGRGNGGGVAIRRIGGAYALLGSLAVVPLFILGPSTLGSVLVAALRKIFEDRFAGKVPTLAGTVDHLSAYGRQLPDWLSDYLGPTGLTLLAITIVAALIRRDRKAGFLLAPAFVFVFVFMVVPGWVVPRYLVPAIVLAIPPVAALVDEAMRRLQMVLTSTDTTARHRETIGKPVLSFILVFLFGAVLVSGTGFQLVASDSPDRLPLPAVDRDQYIGGTPAGYGYREALNWIRQDTGQSRQVLVVARYVNSNFEYVAKSMGMDVLVVPELRYLGFPKELSESIKTQFSERLRDPNMKVYYLPSRPASDGIAEAEEIVGLRIEPIRSFPKPGDSSVAQLYGVTPTVAWIESRVLVDLLSEAKQGKLSLLAPGDADPGAYIHAKTFTIRGEGREVLFMHPMSSVGFRQQHLPAKARLEFGLAVDPEAWEKTGDGVEFQAVVKDGQQEKTVFSSYIDPKHDLSQRRWIDSSVSLAEYAGKDVEISLRTQPHTSTEFDWAGWATPRLTLP